MSKQHQKQIESTRKSERDRILKIIDEEIIDERNSIKKEIERKWDIVQELEYIKRRIKGIS